MHLNFYITICHFFNCILISCFIVLFQYEKTRKWIIIFLGVLAIFSFYNTYNVIKSHESSSEKIYSLNFKNQCIEELELNDKKEIVCYSLNKKVYKLGAEKMRYEGNFGFLELIVS